MYFIGIDGGGTKTKGILADRRGNILSEATVGPTNPNSAKMERIKEEFGTLLQTLKSTSGIHLSEVAIVFAGISGAEHPAAKGALQLALGSLFSENVKVVITNDAITALYSGTMGKPGIVQIAGTGRMMQSRRSIQVQWANRASCRSPAQVQSRMALITTKRWTV
ncbi:ROK family protein [Salisediminibacterium beveridgei]|uniref:ROK family protein n=1 Tax=Salisediminibacterium beveridgei TaxID=632773 RepID=UPI000847D965|nr:BadF/BadG/BcrA/BcrD ATPase family protein [Salisediminibacterium beveridgei]